MISIIDNRSQVVAKMEYPISGITTENIDDMGVVGGKMYL